MRTTKTYNNSTPNPKFYHLDKIFQFTEKYLRCQSYVEKYYYITQMTIFKIVNIVRPRHFCI